ncbi:MAG: ABC transporter substrate-binding protein [Pleomorphochaeta sp.]
MKKSILAIMVFLLSTTMLFASGAQEKEENATTDDGTIILRAIDWSDSKTTERAAFNKKFEEEHPGVKVEYTCLTIDQFKNTIVTMLKGDDAPDLFPVPNNMNLPTCVDQGWFQPITQYVDDEFLSTLKQSQLVNGISYYNGELYSFPETDSIINSVFFVNMDLLEQAGVKQLPKTYSEFIDACQKVVDSTNGEAYGLIEGGKQFNRNQVMATALCSMAGGKIGDGGKQIVTVDGKSTFNSAEMKGALDFLNTLAAKGLIYPDTPNINAPTARDLFAQGNAAFLMQGNWCVAPWLASYPEFTNYTTVAPPVPDNQSEKYGCPSTMPQSWLGVYKNSKHPELAAEYYMALYEDKYGYQEALVSGGGAISLVPTINEKYMSNQHLIDFYNTAQDCSRVIPVATVRDMDAYKVYSSVHEVSPTLGAIVQGIFAQSLPTYNEELDKLANAQTKEWNRAANAAGVDLSLFEFPNWDLTKDYMANDYAQL